MEQYDKDTDFMPAHLPKNMRQNPKVSEGIKTSALLHACTGASG